MRAAGDAFGGRWVPAHQSCLTFFACLVYYLYADSGPNITYHFVLPIPWTLDVRYLLCLCVCALVFFLCSLMDLAGAGLVTSQDQRSPVFGS